MKIYGGILSPFAARVALACEHKGIAYDMELPADGLKTPAYLKLNPLGKIPAIKDGSTVLFESGVIVRYIDAKVKKKPLVPSAAKGAAEVNLLVTLADLYLQPPGLTLFRQALRGEKDEAAAKAALEELGQALDVIEHYIKPGPCAAGAKLSLADCYLVPGLFFATKMAPIFGEKNILKGRPTIKKYWSAISKQTAAKTVLKGMGDRLKFRLSAVKAA